MNKTAKEIWLPIKKYEGLYEVSNLGRVKSLEKPRKVGRGEYIQKERILKPFSNNKGYLMIALYKDGKRRKTQIHQLVAEAFVPNPNNYNEINHKDENPKNNCVNNLEFCTHKYNCNYGTIRERISKSHQMKIKQYKLDGTYIKTWNSQLEIQNELGIPQANISAVIRGLYKQTHGYRWEVANED